MARTIINLPSEFAFSINIPIRFADLGRRNHVGHETFFVFMKEARIRFLNGLGWSVGSDEGVGLIMTDATIVYLKQGLYGQSLKVDIAVTDLTTKGFNMIYRISDAESGIEMTRAKTGFLVYDYQRQKVTTVPHDFRERFSK